MEINDVEIEDTFCEAFGAVFTRILVTAIMKNGLKLLVKSQRVMVLRQSIVIQKLV